MTVTAMIPATSICTEDLAPNIMDRTAEYITVRRNGEKEIWYIVVDEADVNRGMGNKMGDEHTRSEGQTGCEHSICALASQTPAKSIVFYGEKLPRCPIEAVDEYCFFMECLGQFKCRSAISPAHGRTFGKENAIHGIPPSPVVGFIKRYANGSCGEVEAMAVRGPPLIVQRNTGTVGKDGMPAAVKRRIAEEVHCRIVADFLPVGQANRDCHAGTNQNMGNASFRKGGWIVVGPILRIGQCSRKNRLISLDGCDANTDLRIELQIVEIGSPVMNPE